MTWITGRISSLQSNLINRSHVARATTELQRVGKELSTGRRADIFADLGSKAGGALIMRGREENTQAYMTANGVLDNKLQAMATSVEAVRDIVQGVMQNLLVNASRPSTGASTLQIEAKAALESIVATMNISFNGDHVFSGTRSDQVPLTRWESVNPATGLSPEAIMQGIVGAGPTSQAQAQAMLSEADMIFASADTANPDRNFEATFYNGTPELDGLGQPENRISARIDVGLKLEYGVQANEPAFRDIFKGLALLAATDVSQITDETAYSEWVGGIAETLGSGLNGALSLVSNIGFNQQVVETTQVRLNTISLVQQTQISTYESVDPYEAATELTLLETQLQASYSVSARLSQLSILKFI